MSPVDILGCPCYVLSETQVREMVIAAIEDGVCGYSVAINAEKIHRYRSDPQLKAVIDAAWLPYIDGSGAVLGARWLHDLSGPKIDMPKLLLSLAEERALRVCILGSDEPTHDKAMQEIAVKYPRIRVVGHSHGFCEPGQLQETVRGADPQVTMVAMGSPRQEVFAGKLVVAGLGGLVFGCGGALDIVAGVKRRAPAFFVDNHLEWLYRLWKEPWRIGRQKALPLYFIRLLAAVARAKLKISR